jgi:hypothetical protein
VATGSKQILSPSTGACKGKLGAWQSPVSAAHHILAATPSVRAAAYRKLAAARKAPGPELRFSHCLLLAGPVRGDSNVS